MLLLIQRFEVADLAEVGIIFQTDEQVRTQFAREPGGGGKICLSVFAEAEVDDRIDDELVDCIADADDRSDFKPEARLREGRRLVTELKVDAIEEVSLFGMRRNE